MQTREENLNAIIEYIEKAGLTFTEPFSLISATVVEASYYTGISKNVILVHINRTFKKKYGQDYIKAQMIAHNIAYGKNPNEERIMSKNLDEESNEPKQRKERQATTKIGVAFKGYTGLISKDNRGLYGACNRYYYKYHEFPWKNKDKWDKMCKKYNFEDKKLSNEQECSINTN